MDLQSRWLFSVLPTTVTFHAVLELKELQEAFPHIEKFLGGSNTSLSDVRTPIFDLFTRCLCAAWKKHIFMRLGVERSGLSLESPSLGKCIQIE